MVKNMKRTGPTNPNTKKIIEDLFNQGHKEKSKFKINLAKQLSVPTRQRAKVNLVKLQRVCKENEIIVVPGKVLSYGILTKPLTVSALSFSDMASKKIQNAGGKIITITELVKQTNGKNVRLIK